MICLLIYGSNVSKNAGPIELHWVTCRYAMYLRAWRMQRGIVGRAEWRSGIYSTTFWLRLILKNRHRQKLRAHPRAYVLARARRPYLFAPRVLRYVLRLSFLPLFPLSLLALVILNSLCRRFAEEIYGWRKRRRIILVRLLSLCMLKLRIKNGILK